MMKERNNKEIIIRIFAQTNLDELQEIADYLRYKEIRKKSHVSQKQVDSLVKKIKKSRWEKTKARLGL